MDLLADIKKQSRGLDLFLLIINDHSRDDYTAVEGYLELKFQGKYQYIVNPVNNAKVNYWKTINMAYGILSDKQFDYFIQLADDMKLVRDFFHMAIRKWKHIDDEKKACLNISVDFTRLMKAFWTSVQPHHVSFNGYEYIRTGWTDLCFISSRAYLEALNFTVDPVSLKWSGNKDLSSGVGMQISRRLIAGGYSIYSLKRSLVISDDHPSVMHPELRKRQKLVTNHDLDRVTASMATMPGRESSLMSVVESIIHQVDELRIYANNLTRKNIHLHHKKVKWFYSKDHLGDLGDVGKFYQCEDISGYHFTIDDDLIYPSDYVYTMIEAIERYGRKCVISAHGRIFPTGPVRSYYKGAMQQFSCLRNVSQDVYAHVVGTGVLAYHTDTLKVPFGIFEASNMADIWFSRHCQQKGIPRMIIKHQGGWIKDSQTYDQFSSIYFHNVYDESLQTRIMNTCQWSLP